MRILRNTSLEKDLKERVREKLQSTDRDGIHASDLLSPRLSYFRKTQPVPISEDEIGYFATGHGHHYFMVELLTGLKGESQEESKYSEEYGITYSPDIAVSFSEFKTSRLPKEPASEAEAVKLFEDYAQQSLIYALCEKKDYWNLYVLYIGLRKPKVGIFAPRLRAYRITWTEAELQDGEQWVKETVEDLQQALATNQYDHLPLCAEYKCIRYNHDTGKKEPVCPYFTTCKPGERYREYKKQLSAKTS